MSDSSKNITSNDIIKARLDAFDEMAYAIDDLDVFLAENVFDNETEQIHQHEYKELYTKLYNIRMKVCDLEIKKDFQKKIKH